MKKRRMIAALVLLLTLTGCAQTAVQPGFCAGGRKAAGAVYVAQKEVWSPLVREFEARTGIWVEVVEGGSNELLEQLSQQKDAPQADVMFGGGVESLESYRELFEPYACTDAAQILPQYRAKDDIWTPFSSLPVVFVYNPKLVRAGEITSWKDLLDRRGRERSRLQTRRFPARAIRRW